MTKKVTTMFATMIMFVGTIFVLNAAITPANAQAPNSAGSPGSIFPVLTDSDFKNFLEIYPSMINDPASMVQTLTSKGIDIQHFTGAMTKIITHVQDQIYPGIVDQAAVTYGDSLALNSEEQELFDKYEYELIDVVSHPLAQ